MKILSKKYAFYIQIIYTRLKPYAHSFVQPMYIKSPYWRDD